MQEHTEWHSVVLFGRLGEIAAEYLRKGSQVYIEGSLRTRKWQDKQGNDRYSTEIVANEMQMLGGRGGGGGGGGEAGARRRRRWRRQPARLRRRRPRMPSRQRRRAGGRWRRRRPRISTTTSRSRRVRSWSAVANAWTPSGRQASARSESPAARHFAGMARPLDGQRTHACDPLRPRFRPIDPMPGRYFIKTFGCQMNEYDSARMADVLARGRRARPPTDDPAQADVLLMNTCSVREKAQEKVFSLLGEWRLLKKRSGRTCSSASAAASRARKARPSPSARRSSIWCSARRPCTACRR